MYRKAKNVAQIRSKKLSGKHVSDKNLYMAYSQKGAKVGHGNFLAYVDRALAEYGPQESINQDTRRHMQKIRKVLSE